MHGHEPRDKLATKQGLIRPPLMTSRGWFSWGHYGRASKIIS
jgi:hypothetical protein